MAFCVSSRSGLVGLVLCSIVLAVVLTKTGCTDIRIEMTAEHATRWTDVKVGSGPEAKPGTEVVVKYWLALPDGTRVVDLYAQNRSHPFRVGDGTVIAGLDQAVRGMRMGGVRDVTLPPIAHYGRKGYADVIPPDTTLTMKVELLAVRF